MQNVSVCIATYNGERFIEKQLLSILNQLDKDDEVIISDDSSTDNTIQIIRKLQDRRVVLLENQTFKNPLWNFENALKHVKYNIIFLSDQDDIWEKGKVAAVKKALETADLVLTDRSIIDASDKVLLPSYAQKFPNRFRKGFLNNLLYNSYTGCSMAFHKKVLVKALPFPKDIGWHDWWIGMVAEVHFNVCLLKIPLTLYRQHEQNFSYGSTLTSGNSFFRKMKNRFNVLKYIPLLLFKR
jgi:glycosyltransferase involved in cell wall biosynthesis